MRLARLPLWSMGAPFRWVLVGAIRLYQAGLSGVLGGGQCRFSPGCSRYAIEAIQVHGAIVGSALAIRRILRCNPFGRGGLDPVPATRWYERIIQNPRAEGVRRAR